MLPRKITFHVEEEVPMRRFLDDGRINLFKSGNEEKNERGTKDIFRVFIRYKKLAIVATREAKYHKARCC